MASNTAQKPKAGEPGDAHIPCAFNAPALVIKSEPVYVESMPTIFVGIVDDDYPETHWQDHCKRIKDLFGIAAGSFGELKVKNRGNKTVDGPQLARDMQKAVEIINSGSFDKIRIVHVGIGHSPALDQALKSLIRGWNLPSESKNIQIVALGDSIDHHYLSFCKSLCLNQLCNVVQYYNTMDYDQFGYVDSTWPLLRELSTLSLPLMRGGDMTPGALLRELSTLTLELMRHGDRTQEDPTGTQPDN